MHISGLPPAVVQPLRLMGLPATCGPYITAWSAEQVIKVLYLPEFPGFAFLGAGSEMVAGFDTRMARFRDQ